MMNNDEKDREVTMTRT